MSDHIFINNSKLQKFIKAAKDEDLAVILTLYLLMCDTNKEKEILYSEDIDLCLDVHGEDRTYPVLDKWFLFNEDSETYTPLVSIFDFLNQ